MADEYEPHLMVKGITVKCPDSNDSHERLKRMGYVHVSPDMLSRRHYMFKGKDDPLLVAHGDHAAWEVRGYANKLQLHDGTTLNSAEEFFERKRTGTLAVATDGHWSSSSGSCSDDNQVSLIVV